ncbi:MAG: 50S ribosomal protein L9 [Deltaproteobacteria bacterium]|nr:50S ribosomal protein L9 [Deltaproteobacteria bacterium]
MQVILKKDIPQLGRIGELVKVRNGYARNFLIPRSMAVAASTGNVEELEHQKKLVDLHKKKIQKESEAFAATMKSVSITISRKFNDAGKMFGSITTSDVSESLTAAGHNFDRRDLEVDAIKGAGNYSVKVRLPGDVFTTIQLNVEAQVEKTAKSDGKKTKTRTAGAKKTKAKAETAAADESEAKTDTDSE